jgi:hypothetical protein
MIAIIIALNASLWIISNNNHCAIISSKIKWENENSSHKNFSDKVLTAQIR